MPVRYVGKICPYTGNTLFEILRNLKNYGVGRVVLRNSLIKKYPETSFYVIRKVIPLRETIGEGPKELLYGKVWVDEIYRGRKLPGEQILTETTYLEDYQLVPKEKEDFYLNFKSEDKLAILPKYSELPPLLSQIMQRQLGYTPKVQLIYENLSNHLIYKIAEEGETPTHHTKITIPDKYFEGIHDKRKHTIKN